MAICTTLTDERIDLNMTLMQSVLSSVDIQQLISTLAPTIYVLMTEGCSVGIFSTIIHPQHD